MPRSADPPNLIPIRLKGLWRRGETRGAMFQRTASNSSHPLHDMANFVPLGTSQPSSHLLGHRGNIRQVVFGEHSMIRSCGTVRHAAPSSFQTAPTSSHTSQKELPGKTWPTSFSRTAVESSSSTVHRSYHDPSYESSMAQEKKTALERRRNESLVAPEPRYAHHRMAADSSSLVHEEHTSRRRHSPALPTTRRPPASVGQPVAPPPSTTRGRCARRTSLPSATWPS